MHAMAVIPSRLRDNKILLSRDPKYINRLQLVGSKELVRAWLEGDWSAIEGAFFDEWSEGRHVIRPFAVPPMEAVQVHGLGLSPSFQRGLVGTLP